MEEKETETGYIVSDRFAGVSKMVFWEGLDSCFRRNEVLELPSESTETEQEDLE